MTRLFRAGLAALVKVECTAVETLVQKLLAKKQVWARVCTRRLRVQEGFAAMYASFEGCTS